MSRRSSRDSVISSKMSYGEIDVDSTTGTHDYKKIAKKLAKDKANLKDKLSRLLDEVDSRAREHRRQLEKNQEYFQDQISDLTEERDNLLQDLEKSKTILIEERETFRRQLEEKISKQREIMEKRFSTKDTQIVKRLEMTIEKLQEKLNLQLNSQLEEKEEIERSYLEKEGELRQTITELQGQIQALKEYNLKERKELQVLVKNYNEEKDKLTRDMGREKEEEIARAIGEKNVIIANLQHIKDNAEKRAKQAEQNRDETIAQIRNESETICIELKQKLTEANNNLVKRSTQLYTECEGKIQEKERQHKEMVDSIQKDYERRLQEKDYENSRKMEALAIQVQTKYENDQKTISKLQTDLENTRHQLASETTQKEQEIKNKYELTLQKIQSELSGKLETKEKEFEMLSQRDRKIIAELQDINENLKGQILSLQAMLRKVQENSQHMNGQFVSNLNQQKELSEKEIAARDDTIFSLQKDLKRLGEESVDRMNGFERKLKLAQEENNELTGKLIESKSTIENLKKQFAEYSNETTRIKTKMVEDFKALTEERDKLKKSMEIMTGINMEINAKKQELATAMNEILSLRNQVNILKSEKNGDAEEIDRLKKNVAGLSAELSTKRDNIYALAKDIQTLKGTVAEHHSEREELERLRKIVQTQTDKTPEIEKLKTALINLNTKHETIVQELNANHKREMEKLIEKVKEQDKFIAQVETRIEKLKGDFLVKLNASKQVSPGDQAKIAQLEKEKEELKTYLVATERKLQQITYDFASMESNMKMRNDMIAIKEKELEKKEEMLANAPPKLLDPTIKKTRDQALADLRSAKLELSKVKEEALEMTQKLQAAEGVAREIEKEKKLLLQAQHELKTTFINNLNHQQTKHEQEMAQKDNRIKELESVLTQKIK